MKVLMIGGTGTISHYIMDLLIENKHEIIVINHHDHGLENKNVKCILCDRKDYATFIQTVKENGPYDCVFDMITFSLEDCRSAIEAYKDTVKQVIFCSTVDIYSKEGKHYPISEKSETKPRESFGYGYYKQKCEEMYLDAYQKKYFNVTILRPGHAYAPGKNSTTLLFNMLGSGRALSYILDRIQKGKPIILHGDGMSIWNVTHAKDTARAFYNAMGNKKAYGKAYTIAGEECMSFREYYHIVAKVMKAPPLNIVYIPTDLLCELEPKRCAFPSENFTFNNIFDTSAAKEDLDFKQTMTWQEGVKDFLDYHNKYSQYVNSDNEEFAFYDRIISLYLQMKKKMVQEYHDI